MGVTENVPLKRSVLTETHKQRTQIERTVRGVRTVVSGRYAPEAASMDGNMRFLDCVSE
ncbi:hypothetical protein JCM18750_35120 [Halostagnicola bangensis]